MKGAAPGLPRRLASMVYEAVLLFAVGFFAAWLFFFASGGRDATGGAARHLLQIFIALIYAGYFLWCWLRGGQTLAMKAWRLRLVRVDGRPLNLPLAIARYVLALIGTLVFAVTFLWAFVDRERAFLHDRLVGTRIIKL